MVVSSWDPLSVHYATLEQASLARKGDKEFVRAVVAKNGRALKLATPTLQHDTEVVLAASTLPQQWARGRSHGTHRGLTRSQRLHYVAKEATNVATKQDRPKIWRLGPTTTRLDVSHFNSQLLFDAPINRTIGAPAASEVILPTLVNNWFGGLWFDVLNLGDGPVKVSTSDEGVLNYPEVAAHMAVKYEVIVASSGRPQWLAQARSLH